VEFASATRCRFVLKTSLCVLVAIVTSGQQIPEREIPPNFNKDLETAALLRPQFLKQSLAATGRYATGQRVFEGLVQQLPTQLASRFAWELRIVDDNDLNAYSSPDGTIFIEAGLANLAAQNTGLWAAILSHEVAHITRRDWAQRYLYQRSLEAHAANIALGDPGLPGASWTDSQKASQNLGLFCRQLEVEADRDGLMLMARAGYHPDFVPALHHLLHAQGPESTASLSAMHPCWEERDRELVRAYVAAGLEFEQRWHDWYASPGGNPPIVVFADSPTVRKTGAKEWEVEISMNCRNLAGAIEVVLRGGFRAGGLDSRGVQPQRPDLELRELTGCTSPRTLITFHLGQSPKRDMFGKNRADVYVLDDVGSVLARANVPKLPQ